MTVVIPLEPPSEAGPSRYRPLTFGTLAADPLERLADAVRSLRRAKRVVVVNGAGVSTAADIPDFRSASGLFRRGKSAKDLFHVKALTDEHLLPAHHALLNELCSMSISAHPTRFHHYLRSLDTAGHLLRCYTQNIDGLEAKAGLDVGIPAKRHHVKKKQALEFVSDAVTEAPPKVTPKCIPLHGQLTHLYCPLCSTWLPIADHLPLPAEPLLCPTCHLSSIVRDALSERRRRVGQLRASVVLYGEDHPQGESIGTVVERDLRGSRRKGDEQGKVDFLLVAGTSLAIPGVKRIVKEMARALRPQIRESEEGVSEIARAIRTVYVNEEPPKGAEWDGIFDVWVQGDVQRFIARVEDPNFALAPPVTPRKRKVIVGPDGLPTPPKSRSRTPAAKRHKTSSDLPSPTPSPAPHGSYLPTPRATPVKFPPLLPIRQRDDSLTPLSELESEMDNPFAPLSLGVNM